MPKLTYKEDNEQIIEASETTESALVSKTFDTTIVSAMTKRNTRKRLVIRNHIHTNEFGNTRIDSYFIVFDDIVKKRTTGYLDQAILTYNIL